ncbi:MAG: amidohydrolase family protein [Phycisphaeraceae bacterium]
MTTTHTPHASTQGSKPITDANRLGLDFAAEAGSFGYDGPIIDIHTHISSPRAAEVFLDVADAYGIEQCWTMTGLSNVQPIRESLPPERQGRIQFICVPDFTKREEPNTFTTDWLKDIEDFYAAGSRIIKYWAGPRGLDFEPGPDSPMRLGSPIRRQGMQLAYDLGYRVFMTHVADPDTWFQTAYADSKKYGTKLEQYKPLEELLDQYHDVTWIGAHMGGNPEDLDWLHDFLGRHPNYVIDCSATKWQVRELSRDPQRMAQFVAANPGRVLFGSDIVAWPTNTDPDPENPDADHGFDLYASRYWSLRTMLETDYEGPSPIVDPDLHKVDPSVDPKSTATLRGAGLPADQLQDIYYGAATGVLTRGCVV